MTPATAPDLVKQILTPGTTHGVRVGEPIHAGRLSLFPLFHAAGRKRYLLYGDAVARGFVRVDEVSEGGAVPELTIANDAPMPILLVDGEILIGLKQNRVLTTTVLVPAKVRLTIPVACVEQGRWHRATAAARCDDLLLAPSVRGRKNRSVQESIRASGTYRADQVAVWDSVAEHLAAHGVPSPTMAYTDIAARKKPDIDRVIRHLRPAPQQTGVAALVDGRPICVDLFDRSTTLRRLWKRLLGSYVTDAVLEAGTPTTSVSSDAVTAWLAELEDAEATHHAGVGLGDTVVIAASNASATALVVGTAVIHLTAFAEQP